MLLKTIAVAAGSLVGSADSVTAQAASTEALAAAAAQESLLAAAPVELQAMSDSLRQYCFASFQVPTSLAI